MANTFITPNAFAHEHMHHIEAEEFVARAAKFFRVDPTNLFAWFVGHTWFVVWYKWVGLMIWLRTRGEKVQVTSAATGDQRMISRAYWDHPAEKRARKWASDSEVVKHYPTISLTIG
jgi:hypothetical protein